MQGVVTKAEFARVSGVTATRVSQWLREGKIDGAAIVGSGRHARIDVALAQTQLDARLDLGQRLGSNGRAQLASASPDPTDAAIKAARLRQLILANERAAEEARIRAGAYIDAAAAKQEMGRIAAAMVAAFDGALPDLADAVAGQADPIGTTLHRLRIAWRGRRQAFAPSRARRRHPTRNDRGGPVTLLANPRRLAEAIAAAFRPAEAIDYLQCRGQHRLRSGRAAAGAV